MIKFSGWKTTCWKISQLSSLRWLSNSQRQPPGNQSLNPKINCKITLSAPDLMSSCRPSCGWRRPHQRWSLNQKQPDLFLRIVRRTGERYLKAQVWACTGRTGRSTGSRSTNRLNRITITMCKNSLLSIARGKMCKTLVWGWRQLSAPFQLWRAMGGLQAWLPNSWLGWQSLWWWPLTLQRWRCSSSQTASCQSCPQTDGNIQAIRSKVNPLPISREKDKLRRWLLCTLYHAAEQW